MSTRIIAKITATVVIFIVITSQAQAQVPAKIGIIGGANLSDMAGANYNTKVKAGVTAGVIVTFDSPLLPLTFEPELLYSVKGINYHDETIRLDYFEVPFVVKYDLLSSSPVSPSLLVGPYIAINTYSSGESPTVGTVEITKAVEEFDYGVVVGAEVRVSRLIFGARYNTGFNRVFVEEVPIDGRNQAVSLFAGFAFK